MTHSAHNSLFSCLLPKKLRIKLCGTLVLRMDEKRGLCIKDRTQTGAVENSAEENIWS
jgi:hypothetical protein